MNRDIKLPQKVLTKSKRGFSLVGAHWCRRPWVQSSAPKKILIIKFNERERGQRIRGFSFLQ
jgi:hypothetical protein